MIFHCEIFEEQRGGSGQFGSCGETHHVEDLPGYADHAEFVGDLAEMGYKHEPPEAEFSLLGKLYLVLTAQTLD